MSYADVGYEIFHDEFSPHALACIEADYDNIYTDTLLRCQNDREHATAHLEAARILRNTAAGHEMAASPVLQIICSRLLKRHSLVISGPSLIISKPGATSHIYTWHAEAHWYPLRRNFVNLWMPVSAKTRFNGTMAVKHGSHVKRHSFREYRGERVQYEIPENELSEFEEVFIEANPGDVVAFHPWLAHRSVLNESQETTYAMTVRAFDYSNDLTPSANWAERPYQLKES